MNVIRRCPSCGTTSPIGGECDACHEAQVRFYCTDHTPGLWLDGPTCSRCQSRVVAASARPETARVPSTRPASTAPRPSRTASRPPPSPAVFAPPREPLLKVEDWIARDTGPSRGRTLAGCALRLLLFLAVVFLALVTSVVVFGRAVLGL